MDCQLGGQLMKKVPGWVPVLPVHYFLFFILSPSPTSSSSSSPPSPLILDMGISGGLTVTNDASANPSRGKRPSPWQRPARDPQAALDNGTDHISRSKTKGNWFFFFFGPWRTRGVIPLSDYVAFKGLKKEQTFLYPQASCWDAEVEEGPFKNFLGACHGNQALPCFHLSKDRLFYRIVMLSSKKWSRFF